MKDVNSIVEKLENLLNNPTKCKEMGRNSRRLAEKLSWRSVADQYVDLYEKI
jgi:glycosyltransferase involved in cell wall biosynthesis